MGGHEGRHREKDEKGKVRKRRQNRGLGGEIFLENRHRFFRHGFARHALGDPHEVIAVRIGGVPDLDKFAEDGLVFSGVRMNRRWGLPSSGSRLQSPEEKDR